MSALRVAMVAARFAPEVGGIETHVWEVSRRLAQQGAEVTVLAVDPDSMYRGRIAPAGVRVQRYPSCGPAEWRFSMPLRRAIRAADRSVFDVVHIQGVHTAVPFLALNALSASRGTSRIPTVLTFHTGGHSSRTRTLARGAQWRTLRPYLRGVDRLVAVCDDEVDRFSGGLGLPRSQFAVVRNGAEQLTIDPEARVAMTGSPLILCVARLERYKGQHRLLAAMPELLRRAPGAHLGLVGVGPYEQTLRRLTKRLGVDHAVTFASFAGPERGDLGALLASADVTALLSEYEAHPVSVLEAVAFGIPTVVADGSGLSELAGQGLVEAIPLRSSPRQVAEALLLAASGGRREAQVSIPSWDDTVTALQQVYADVMR